MYMLCTFITYFFLGMDSQAKFASLNLAIVLENGSVWDISFDDKFMAIKKKLLIQLPKSKPYFPFSTNFKVLNFVRNDLRKDIVQYHKKLNKQGHMTIGKSSLHSKLTDIIETPLDFSINYRSGNYDYDHFMCMMQHTRNFKKNWSFQEGIQIGNMFWVFNGGK